MISNKTFHPKLFFQLSRPYPLNYLFSYPLSLKLLTEPHLSACEQAFGWSSGELGRGKSEDQRLFAKSTMRLALHDLTLFLDGAKHRSFPDNFPRTYSRAKLIDR